MTRIGLKRERGEMFKRGKGRCALLSEGVMQGKVTIEDGAGRADAAELEDRKEIAARGSCLHFLILDERLSLRPRLRGSAAMTSATRMSSHRRSSSMLLSCMKHAITVAWERCKTYMGAYQSPNFILGHRGGGMKCVLWSAE